MSSMEMEDPSGGRSPVLSAALLGRIRDLNLDYLELLIAESAGAQAQMRHLPVRIAAAMLALPAQVRALLAGTPYSLYSLGFENTALWRAACETVCLQPGDAAAERYRCEPASSAQQAFCEVALLHAWHLASSSRIASRIVYSMPEQTALRLAALPLWRLKRIAATQPDLLLPRWPTNPAFWPDLVRFAAVKDHAGLALTKLLGHQLIAAEIELAHAGPGALRLTASPRLRGRRLAQLS